MGVNRIMQNSLRTNWTLTDDFQFSFHNTQRPLEAINSDMTPQDILDIAVMSIDLPQLGSDVTAVMQAGEWRVYSAQYQPFTFTITFRDFGSLDLRNYFSAVWMDSQRGYFDDIKSKIQLSINGIMIFESEDCLISAVSQVQMNNANSQIAEFSVEFSSPYYSNSQIPKFGSDSYDNKHKPASATSGDIISEISSVINSVSSWF